MLTRFYTAIDSQPILTRNASSEFNPGTGLVLLPVLLPALVFTAAIVCRYYQILRLRQTIDRLERIWRMSNVRSQ